MSHDIMSASEGMSSGTELGTLTGIKLSGILLMRYLDSYPRSCIYPRLQGPHHTGNGGQQG